MCSCLTWEHPEVSGHSVVSNACSLTPGARFPAFPAPFSLLAASGRLQYAEERTEDILRFTSSLTPVAFKTLKTHPCTTFLRHRLNLGQENLSLPLFPYPVRQVSKISVLTTAQHSKCCLWKTIHCLHKNPSQVPILTKIFWLSCRQWEMDLLQKSGN